MLGYSAAYCPKVNLADASQIEAIRRGFATENVIIAEVGAWVNLLDPNSDLRRKNRAYVAERLALAEAVGARCCVDIGGSWNAQTWYGPDPRNLSAEFFDAMVESVRAVIDQVKPTRTRYTVEMMGWSLPDGPDAYLDLLRAVDRPALGVHLDICNIINSPARYYHHRELIAECFQKLGPQIISCHAKDLQWVTEMNVHFLEVVPGRGGIDYAAYLRALAALPVDAPLMLEHLKTAEEYEEGRRYIQKVGAGCGVTFA